MTRSHDHRSHRGWDPDAPPHDVARFADSGGVRIHYLDSGPVPPADTGDAADTGDTSDAANGSALDPIVFVPGITCVADDYVGVLPAFGRRVLVLDLRGRGRSDTPQSGYHRDDHVRDIEAVVADAGLDRFHLTMFSRGTAYALAYALVHPERVRSLAIGDYIGGELGVPEGWPPAFATGRWRGTPVPSRIRPLALERVAEESVERRYYDELEALGKPMLVVRSGAVLPGGHTFVDEDEQAQYRRCGAQIVTFEDSGHDLFRNDPGRFPSLVRSLAETAEAAETADR